MKSRVVRVLDIISACQNEEKRREGGIFPPLTLVFPPFAHGGGQALTAVGIKKDLKV